MKATLWAIVGAFALAFVVFAPVGTAGIHVEGGDPSKRYSREWQVSLLGLETTLWLWLGASGVVVALVLLIAAIAGRRSPSARPQSSDGAL